MFYWCVSSEQGEEKASPEREFQNKTMPEQPYLIINCAEGDLQIILADRDFPLYTQSLYTPGKAMKHIAPGIDTALHRLELAPADLTGIACITGPGSFTGIRMSLAHAQGMACTLDIPMAGISYFQALALGPGPLLSGSLWILIHSRRNQVYGQCFSAPDLQSLTPAQNLQLDSLKPLLDSQSSPVYLLGSGVRKNPDFFQESHGNVLPPVWDTPRPQDLAALAARARWSRSLPDPEYLRASEAEENLVSIAAQRGLDLDRAREILEE